MGKRCKNEGNRKRSGPFGVPTVKQFYVQLKKDEENLVLFAHFLACKV